MSAAEQIGRPAEVFVHGTGSLLGCATDCLFCADLFFTPPVSQARPFLFFFLRDSSLRVHRCI
jgi:hypothetical protein